MSTQFQATESKLMNVYDGSNNIFLQFYQVPEYQRPYTWNEEQVESLWEDIMREKDETGNYFLGNVIVMPNKENRRNDIIDGQQRITTLTLFFLILRNFLSTNTEKGKEYNALLNRCIQDNDIKNRRLHLLQSHENQRIIDDLYGMDSKESLKQYFINKKIKKSDLNILKNASKIFDLAEKNEEKLEGFVQYILNKVTLLSIKCQEHEDALKIFHTINSKGVPLSQVDIIKVRFLQNIKAGFTDEMSARERIKQFNDDWKEMIDKIEEWNEADTFFSSYYISKIEDKTTNSLHKDFESKIFKANTTEEALLVFKDLQASVTNWIENYIEDDKNIYKNLLHYLPWESYIFAIIFAIYRNIQEEKKIANILKEVFRFYYLHYIAGSASNIIKQTSFNIIKNINKDDLYEMKNTIEENLQKYNIVKKVKEALRDNAYNEKWLKPTLFAVEYGLMDEINFLEIDKIQIEHILPKRFEEGNAGYEFKEGEVRECVDKIGNLTLLSKITKKNQEAGNKSFPKKLEIYKGINKKEGKITKYELTRKLIDDNINDPIWRKEKIDRRTDDLIKEISKVLEVDLN